MQARELLFDDPGELRQLDGSNIIDVFRQFVLDHPSVVGARKALPANETNRAIFEQGQYPGPTINYRWPICVTADEIAFAFVHQLAYFVSAPAPEPSPEQTRAAYALGGRWSTLIKFFQDQVLMAYGTYHATGARDAIDRHTWRRKNVVIDMENGDLAEIVNHQPVVLWRGLSVSVGPVVDSHQDRPKPTAGHALQSAPALTAGEASIKAAIAALWPTGIPKELSKKARDTRIIEWQKTNDATVTSTKAIYRYLKSFGL